MWHLDKDARERGLASLSRIWYGEDERNTRLVAGVLALVGVILVVAGVLAVWSEVSAALDDTWDGTYQCRPGETYTTKECE